MNTAKIPAPNTLINQAALRGSHGSLDLPTDLGLCLKTGRIVVETGQRWPAAGLYQRYPVKLTAANRAQDPTNPWASSEEETLRAAGLAIPLTAIDGGDFVFSRPFNPRRPQDQAKGHCGVVYREADGRLWVLENVTVERGKLVRGALRRTPLSEWDEVTTAIRFPEALATPLRPSASLITAEMLRVSAPNLTLARAQQIAPQLAKAAQEFGIDTPAEVLAFVANGAHESIGWTRWEEVGERAYFQRYEGSKTLGNTQAGDGYRFRGRGPGQLTGRWNYMHYGRKLGLDLIAQPDKAAELDVGSRLFALFWTDRGCNGAAARGDFRRACQLLNGGFNGYPDRLARFGRLRAVYGLT